MAIGGVKVEGLEAFRKAMRLLRPAVKRASRTTMNELGIRYERKVKAGYTKWPGPGTLTQEKRAFGKMRGLTRAIPRYAPTPTFRQSGRLIASIRRLSPSLTAGVFARSEVGIQNKRIAATAVVQEQGARYYYFPSAVQWRYLMALIHGRQRPTRATKYPPLYAPQAITTVIPARPIWEPAMQPIFLMTQPLFAKYLLVELMKLPFFDIVETFLPGGPT